MNKIKVFQQNRRLNKPHVRFHFHDRKVIQQLSDIVQTARYKFVMSLDAIVNLLMTSNCNNVWKRFYFSCKKIVHKHDYSDWIPLDLGVEFLIQRVYKWHVFLIRQ